MKKELIKNMVSLLVGEALLEFIENPTSPNIVNDLREKYSEKILSAIDSMQEEPVSEDLEEAAKIYARGEYDRKNPSSLPWQCKGCYSPLIYAFKDGAIWQKQQMMKETICTTMQEDDCGDIVPTIANQKGFKIGDKVKLIIIKED